MTQGDVAHRLGVNRSTVSGWENGRRPPTRATIMAYATFTSTSLVWLMGEAS